MCYILIDKQMLEKKFCSNIAPSLTSGKHLIYKAEHMGRSCLNPVLGWMVIIGHRSSKSTFGANKQMLQKVFCSNIAPSLSSGNHLFYKAEYMGQSCPNQVWAITFD